MREELLVVVDDLGVVHGRAVLGLEVLERLVLGRVVVVGVDVARPVREVELRRGGLGGRRLALDADGRRGCRAARRGGPAALRRGTPVPLVPHAARKAAVPVRAVPWMKRRRVMDPAVDSRSSVIGLLASLSGIRPGSGASAGGRQSGSGSAWVAGAVAIRDDEAVVRRPRQPDLLARRPQLGAAWRAPRSARRRSDRAPPRASTTYCVLTPMYDASRTMPWSWLCPDGRRPPTARAGGSSRDGRRRRRGPRPSIDALGARTRVSSSRRTVAYAAVRALDVTRQQVADAEEAGHEARARVARTGSPDRRAARSGPCS